MFEAKQPRGVEKEASTETEGSSSKRSLPSLASSSLGSSSLGYGSGSGSLYLYDSQDWVVSPGCSPETEHPNAVSPMLAEETFRYMNYLSLDPASYSHPGSHSLNKVLSGASNEIDVVTHLLAERDRDLELAARIGQSLLQRNHGLQERNESMEEQLAQALDRVHQLQHELGKKDELLRMVASASEESETDSNCSTPLLQRHAQPPGVATALSQLEALQSKLNELEEENITLRSEASHLKKETICYEEKEQQLVSDCVKELRESNSQMVGLTEDLTRKNEEVVKHQEEIAALLGQIVELQHRVKELALEKEELRIHLTASKNAQRQLTAELNELADRNAECVGMLQESQEEIKELRNKNTPAAGMRRHAYGLFPLDSLAAEIEGTMRRELSVDEESVFEDQRVSQKRVFQTVRCANETVERVVAMTAPPIPGSGRSNLVMTSQPFQSGQSKDSNREEVKLGLPGAPGGKDLEDALHRLSLRRHNFMCERQFFQAERDRKLQAMAGSMAGSMAGAEGSGYGSPMGSAYSSCSNLSEFSLSSSLFKTFLPEKLQIVKPMEGSLTLHHWQMLAKPHLGTILDPHPGVVTKGFRPLPQDSQPDNVYRLTDLEEDEEDGEQKGWRERKKKEKNNEEEEEEEEEGGITFNVKCASTPEEKERARKRPPSPLPVSSLAPPPQPSPAPVTSDLSSREVIRSSIASQSVQTGSVTTITTVHSQSQVTTTTTTGQHPGKCQSSTFSTYTFTTCRILHPSDVTQVTSSSHSSQGSAYTPNTPSSLRSGPSTPVTPCRLTLTGAFPPRRPTAPPGGLAKLVLEKGISAQISLEEDSTQSAVPPRGVPRRVLPGTPPNSPSHSPPPSPVPFEARPVPIDNFLASRPAELFLQDVYGLKLGRAPRPDLPSPTPGNPPPPSLGGRPFSGPPRAKRNPANVGLLEKLRRMGLAKVLQGSEFDGPPPSRRDSATFVAAGGGSLLDGLRRNQSLPAMVGGAVCSHASQAAPPRSPLLPHPPTSLAIPPPPWGNLKEAPNRRLSPASVPRPAPKR